MRREEYISKNRELAKDKAELEAEKHRLEMAARAIEDKAKAEEHAHRLAENKKRFQEAARQMKTNHDAFVAKVEIDKKNWIKFQIGVAKIVISFVNGHAHPEELHDSKKTEIHLIEEQFQKKKDIEKKKAMEKQVQESIDKADLMEDAREIDAQKAEERAERAKEVARKMEEFRKNRESISKKRNGYER